MNAESGVEFALFAPYNESVAVIGAWNDWQPQPMTRGDDGWWRIRVPLEDGDHPYKFEVVSKSFFAEGETLHIPDPRAVHITLDADENSVVRVRGGRAVIHQHEWQHDDVPLPSNAELVIYEVLIADFAGGPGDIEEGKYGTFQDVIDKLDYLADELGVNAVELMPVNEFPGEHSWGYNPRGLFAVENSYGTPGDFARLVDECHGRGIRVIYDGVYNHTENSAPLTRIDYNYWYHQHNPDPPEMQWGAKFNMEFHDPELGIYPARQFLRDAAVFWVEHFHIDGIRFDATAAIDSFDFLRWLHAELYGMVNGMKPFITIAENVPENPAITGPDGPLDAAWHEAFSKQMMATLTGQEMHGRPPHNVDALASVFDGKAQGYTSPVNLIHYIDNHDQDRILWQLGQAGFMDDAAFRRMKLGASLLLTAPGIPLIWMGQEFGESAPKTLDRQPIDWALLQNQRNADLRSTYAGLIYLRKSNPALHTPNIQFIMLDAAREIVAYQRWNDEGNVVVVVANLRDSFAGDVTIHNWPWDGTWHEYTDNYDVHVEGGVLHDQLAESEVKIYILQ